MTGPSAVCMQNDRQQIGRVLSERPSSTGGAHRQVALGDVGEGPGGDAVRPVLSLGGGQGGGPEREPRLVAERGEDDVVLQVAEDFPADVFLAEPPGFDEGQEQVLVEQGAADPRQERHQRARAGETRAGRVAQGDVAGAPRLHQAGHAVAAVAARFQRVEAVVLQPTGDRVDPAQAGQGFEVEPPLAHREVAGFHQRDAERARFEGVLEVPGMPESGREQHDQRRLVAHRRHVAQDVALGPEERRDARDVGVLEFRGQDVGGNAAAFQRLAQAAGDPGMVA